MSSRHWQKLRQRILWTRQLVQRQLVQSDGWERIRANLAWRTVSEILTNRENENVKRFSYIWSRESCNVKTSADIRPTIAPEFAEYSAQFEHCLKWNERLARVIRSIELIDKRLETNIATSTQPIDVTQFSPRTIKNNGATHPNYLSDVERRAEHIDENDTTTKTEEHEQLIRACRRVAARIRWKEGYGRNDARNLHWTQFLSDAYLILQRSRESGKLLAPIGATMRRTGASLELHRAAFRGYRKAIQSLTERGFGKSSMTRDYRLYLANVLRVVRLQGLPTKEQRASFRKAYIESHPFTDKRYMKSTEAASMREVRTVAAHRRKQRAARLAFVATSADGTAWELANSLVGRSHTYEIESIDEARGFLKLLCENGLKRFVALKLKGIKECEIFAKLAKLEPKKTSPATMRRRIIEVLKRCKREHLHRNYGRNVGSDSWQVMEVA